MQTFTEPRPRREDIPDTIDTGDVLFEVRLNRWEDRKWRSEVNGDLGFLRRFRGAVNDTITGLVIGVLRLIPRFWMRRRIVRSRA